MTAKLQVLKEHPNHQEVAFLELLHHSPGETYSQQPLKRIQIQLIRIPRKIQRQPQVNQFLVQISSEWRNRTHLHKASLRIHLANPSFLYFLAHRRCSVVLPLILHNLRLLQATHF